ncbi:hypothetical protein EDD21DRAFT_213621 [Dissophora ornata]|nr:hypothetical protein EDD21DRAFT_213621 [Dissophora ornata]
MDDTEGELGTTSAYDDDDFISSSSDNLLDENIDLLDDEEFPLTLQHEEMAHHPLASSTYDHELEEPSPRQLRGAFEDGEDVNSNRLSYQQSQRQLLQQQQQLQQQQLLQQQQQQQQLDAERFREPVPSSSGSPRLKHSGIAKSRKAEVLSRLPMPRGIQQPQASSPTANSPIASSPSSSSLAAHRLSLAGSGSRRSSSNISPPLGQRPGRDARASPELTPPNSASESNGNSHNTTNSNNTQKTTNGTSSSNSASHLKRPSVTTMKQTGSRPNSNSTASPAQTNSEPLFGLHSPTSPKVTTAAVAAPAQGSTSISQTASSTPPTSAPSTATTTTSWTFSLTEMQEFVREHRTELQDCGELSKRETKLLKNVMLGMSSTAMAQSTGYGGDRESFERYLAELDEIVDEKLITVVAMSQKLKALRSQK